MEFTYEELLEMLKNDETWEISPELRDGFLGEDDLAITLYQL